MRTVFASHSDVCRAWAAQSQMVGRGGNISFNRDTIYSYDWWPMARLLPDGTVLLRDETYSQSTCQHQNHVWRAVYSRTRQIFNVIDCVNDDHAANIAHYVARCRESADQFWNSRYYGSGGRARYLVCVEEVKKYATYFKCEHLLPPLFGLELDGPRAKTKLGKRIVEV